MELNRILNREIFLYLLDREVKRGRRYQNFFCLLILELIHLSREDNRHGLWTCYKKLTDLLKEEFRESDLLGSLSENRLAVLLPYADLSAGGQAQSHFESRLKYYDFKSDGYEVKIDKICFPVDGTDVAGLGKKLMELEKE